MDIRVGIQRAPRELELETSLTAAEVEAAAEAAIAGTSPSLRLIDAGGAVYLIPASALAYVQIGSEESRRVGFVA